MNKLTLCSTVMLASSLYAGQAFSGGDDGGLHFLVKGGLTTGGDDIFDIRYTDGSSKKVKAGGLLEVGAGVLYNAPQTPVSAQLTLNYHFDTASASNGDASFERYPLEGALYYTGVKDWRFGAGARLALSPKAETSIDRNDIDIAFKDTVGYLVEIGYRVLPGFWINLRAVQEDYEVEKITYNGTNLALSDNRDISGDHVGLNVAWAF